MKNNLLKRANKHVFFGSQKTSILFLVLVYILFSAIVHAYIGTKPFEQSYYDSYKLQAQNWLSGKIAFENNYDWLEMAIYNNKYYISFPPSPALIALPFVAVFGDSFSSAVLCEIYSIISLITLYLILNKYIDNKTSALLAFLIIFSSPYISIFTSGAVWHHAQCLSLCCVLTSIYFADNKKPTLSLFMLAVGIGARPFNILYVFPILFLFRERKLKIKAVIKALFVFSLIGLMYAGYNYIRFNNIFEFGHNYLPEFSENSKQFSIKHLIKNLQKFIIGTPFYLTPENNIFIREFGFSLLIAVPSVSIYIVVFICDVVKKRINLATSITFAVFIINSILLLSHKTMGGFQLGARYFIDCLSYPVLHIIFTNGKSFKTSALRIILLLLILTLIFLFISNKYFVLS